MKKYLLSLVLLAAAFSGQAQPTAEVKELHNTAKNFMRQKDLDNAVLVLNRALEKDPQNLELLKDLAYSYHLQRNVTKATEVVKKFDQREDLDISAYQIAATVYRFSDDIKNAEKTYKKGLKRFPASGVLHFEYGEMMAILNGAMAISLWEEGIETDPNYPGNYYHAARYYFNNNDMFWGLMYAEIFVNMESLSSRTMEMKGFLLEGYKKLFQNSDLWASYKGDKTNGFTEEVLQTLNKQSSVAAYGINLETLMAIRTRFILDWYFLRSRPNYKLFEMHRQLLQEGLFEAYNQWLFGSVANAAAYKNWIDTNADVANSLTAFQRGRIFKMPAGQYYQKREN
jgi:tetratricopeptide (TPR) repeat protein